VSLELQKACPHFFSGYCMLCNVYVLIQTEAKANCVHAFKPLVIKAHQIGAMCDLSGGDHMAVVHEASKVSVCELCNTLCCFVCSST
jgi:hypothetical protein